MVVVCELVVCIAFFLAAAARPLTFVVTSFVYFVAFLAHFTAAKHATRTHNRMGHKVWVFSFVLIAS